MINMWRAELYRLTKSKGFYLFLLFSFLTFMISVIYHQPGGISFGAPLEYGDDLKLDIVQTAMNFNYYFFLIIPVFIIIIGEFSGNTVKNTISSAVSKGKYYLSKYIFSMLFSLISFILLNYLFYFINHAVNGEKYSSSIGDFSKAFWGQFPIFAAIISLFIFFAFAFRKGAIFNAVVIIAPIIYTTVSLILYGIEGTKKAAEKLLTYEVSTMISKLTLECTDSYRIKCYIIFAAVTILSFFGGYLLFTKRELD